MCMHALSYGCVLPGLTLALSMQVDTLCLADLHAFIAQALCLQGKPAVELADLQVLSVATLGTARLATGRPLPAFRKFGWCSQERLHDALPL